MCVIWQLFHFYCFSPTSKELCPLSPCNLISRFPLISTSLVPRFLCLVVNAKGVKEHLPTPSAWKGAPQVVLSRTWRMHHLVLFSLLTCRISITSVGAYFYICQFWICFLFQMKKPHFMNCWSETPPFTVSHNNSHNNKTSSYQASPNKLDSPVRKLPSLLLTVLFSPHKPDCSLPVPSCSEDSCSSAWQDLWCISGRVVLPCSRQLGLQLSAGGTTGPCLPAGKGRPGLRVADKERRRGRGGNFCTEEKGGRVEEQEEILEGNEK